MITRIVFLVVAILVALVLFRALRAGRLREKYAALWIIVGAAIILLGIWPGLLDGLAAGIGIALPVNLLFFLAILLLLGVSIHLSMQSSKLEDEIQILDEETAMLWAEVQRLAATNPPGEGHAGPRHGQDDPKTRP